MEIDLRAFADRLQIWRKVRYERALQFSESGDLKLPAQSKLIPQVGDGTRVIARSMCSVVVLMRPSHVAQFRPEPFDFEFML